jgi:hypothetical protein
VLAHEGHGIYSRFMEGCDYPASTPLGKHDGATQKAILGVHGVTPLDVDDEIGYLDNTRTARFITIAHAISIRPSPPPGRRFHVLIWFGPDVPPEERPNGSSIRGADVKVNGFIPWPGCWHVSGVHYEPVHHPGTPPGCLYIVRGTRELAAAMRADQEDEKARRAAERARLLAKADEYTTKLNRQRASRGLPPLPLPSRDRHGGGNGGNGHDGQLAACVLGWVRQAANAGRDPASPEVKEEIYARWCQAAILHTIDPSYPFTREDFEDGHSGHYDSALAKVLREDAEMHRLLYERGGVAFVEDATRQARQLPRRHQAHARRDGRDTPEQVRLAYEREGRMR